MENKLSWIYKLFSNPYFIIIFVGLIVHVVVTPIIYGFPNDMGCFYSWARDVNSIGFGRIYSESGFLDYPPGYLYVLYAIGGILNKFNISAGTWAAQIIIKAPSIVADILSGLFIYQIARKRTTRENSVACAALYAFNPAVILVSSVWGQIDAIYALLCAISIYYLAGKKILASCLIFSAAVIIKPQSLMFAPVYLFAFYKYIAESDNRKEALFKLLKTLGICIAALFVVSAPFMRWGMWYCDPTELFKRIAASFDVYHNVTVNAYNIYALFGLNWGDLNATFLGVTYSVWGVAALVFAAALTLFLLFRNKSESNYFFAAAALVMTVFMFSVKMHERYCFPALILLLMAYVYKRDRRILIIFGLFTLLFFLHYADVLAMALNNWNYAQINTSSRVYSALFVIAYALLIVFAFYVYRKRKEGEPEIGRVGSFFVKYFTPREKMTSFAASDKKIKWARKEFIFISAVTVIYAALAFTNLGDLKDAQNPWIAKTGDECVVDFGTEVQLSRTQYMTNARDNIKFTLYFSDDGKNYDNSVSVTENAVFKWNETGTGFTARYVKISVESDDFRVNEMAFRDYLGNLVTIAGCSGTDGCKNLFDEQDVVPYSEDYMNSTFFDEIYHARTAYEFLHPGLTVYEWTHPPLGKLIMTIGISIFGMVPFGWRFMGTLFGVFMVPAVYAFARRVLKDFRWSALVTVLFAFDFMHYVQTRLATIDTYITLFVILMYYFMYRYWTINYNDKETKFWKTLTVLFLSGLCFGLGIASKFTGFYAGAGLAVLFFSHFFLRMAEYIRARRAPTAENEFLRKKYIRRVVITLLCCIPFFIIIPLAIYVCAYIPYYFGDHGLYPTRESLKFITSMPGLVKFFPDTKFFNFAAAVMQNTLDMYNYHTTLVSTHPFSSKWYQWIVDWRPMFYYSNTITVKLKEGISAFGNPVVWFGGIPAFIYGVYSAAVKRSRVAAFLVIGYLSQLLPWVLVSRTTYIYHYFPSVIFLTLLIGYAFANFAKRDDDGAVALGVREFAAVIVVAAALLLFAMFYPVLTGTPVYTWYVQHILIWMPRWQFLY